MAKFSPTVLLTILSALTLQTILGQTVNLTSPYKLNVGYDFPLDGFSGDRGTYLTGTARSFSRIGSSIYRTHRAGYEFGYTFDAEPGTYDVSLYFYENFGEVCVKGGRIFDVTVGDQTVKDVDVFVEAGCRTAYEKLFTKIVVDKELVITLKSSVQRAFLSGIEILKSGETTTPAPSIGVIESVPASPSLGASPVPSGDLTVSPSASPKIEGSISPTPSSGAKESPVASAEQSVSASASSGAEASISPSALASGEPKPSVSIEASPSVSIDATPAGPSTSIDASPSATSTPVLSAAPSGASPIDATRVNLGGAAAVDDYIADDGTFATTGSSSIYTLTDGVGIYQSHRAGKSFGLSFPLEAGVYDVILHFEENYIPNCAKGNRIFSVDVGGQKVENLDVFSKVGCLKPDKEIFKKVEVTDALVVSFTASAQNAFVSGIEIFLTDDSVVLPSPKPKESVVPVDTTEYMVNVGGPEIDDFVADDFNILTGSSKLASGGAAVSGVYKTHRWGASFGFEIPVKAGVYDVVLYFAETFTANCVPGSRVFDVTVGDKTVEDIDVAGKVGCNTGTTEVFKAIEATELVVIKLTSKVQNAFLAGIAIAPEGTAASPDPIPTETAAASTTPIPSATFSVIPTPVGSDDSGAHSVPGAYDEPFVDFNKDEEEIVTLDGSGSHTHTVNFDTGENAVLTNFKWTFAESGELVCDESESPFCKGTFPMGTSLVTLCVTDSTGDINCVDTSITVVGSLQAGSYCYNYDFGDASGSEIPITKGLKTGPGASPKPVFGSMQTSLSFPNDDSFPDFPFKANSWAQRCVFFFTAAETSKYTFTAIHKGGAAIYVGEQEVFKVDAISEDPVTSSGSVEVPEGLQEMEILYYKKGSGSAQFEFSYGGTPLDFAYDQATILPIITALTPAESGLGGATVKLTGLNIVTGTKVLFGMEEATNVLYSGTTEVQAKAPTATESQEVDVALVNDAGTSNVFTFAYKGGNSGSCEPNDAVEFTATLFGGFAPNVVANIAIGPDLKYYMTTLTGTVIVADVDHEADYVVKSSCESGKFQDDTWKNYKDGTVAQRSALGIAFNPKDTDVKFYISTSTLYWGPGEKDILNDDFAWANGNIETIVPGDGCVVRSGFLIKGLPVSNHDHSVNGMIFDNDGNLHFQVGGFTNQGIPGEKLGGINENPLSGASLIALTSKGADFDGIIKYDDKDPISAKQISGDVSVYASGFRNSFGLALHTNGKFYATDNGPNFSFGRRSLTCTEDLEDQTNKDKIVLVAEGKFHGHPNRNRGECTFINDANKLPDGSDPGPEFNYQPVFSTVDSSTDGIMEYTANTFQGKLKKDMFASKYASQFDGKLYHVGVNGDGSKNFVDQFGTFKSGLSIVQGIRGEIIMPRVFKNEVYVMAPKYEEPCDVRIIAVTPFRGAKGGGTKVIITGHNFGDAPSASFGDNPCTDVTDITATSFKCTTPAGSGLVDVEVTAGGETGTTTDGFWYMNV